MIIVVYVLVVLKQDESCRESEYRGCWLARNNRILDWLLFERSSIICLQVCIFCLFYDGGSEFDPCVDFYVYDVWKLLVFVVMKSVNDVLELCRNFGLEMKNLLICMRRDLVMLVMFILSSEGLTTAVMVCFLA